MSRQTDRGFGISNANTDLNSMFCRDTYRGQRRPFPSDIFADTEETQDPTAEVQGQGQQEVLKELKELKELMREMKKKQGDMEKSIKQLTQQLGAKNFDLSKSSHAEWSSKGLWETSHKAYFANEQSRKNDMGNKEHDKVTQILAKAYIQLGRFAKQNESKTEQLQLEFQCSPYGMKLEELMSCADQMEKAKFTYWRAEERRRVLGIGNWANLQTVSTQEVASKICSLLGVKFNMVLQTAVLRQTSLVRVYIAEKCRAELVKDDKFWLNFYSWIEKKYGPRGPSAQQWDNILQEEE